jgi:transposase-like protein
MINRRGWRYPENFRRTAVERFKCCENIEWLAKELGVPRQTLYRWHEESERNAEEGEPIPEKVERARKEAVITFFDYFRIGLPVTLLTLLFGWFWLSWIR